MHDVETIVKQRRSANKFLKDVEISEKELTEMFSLTKFAPSAFNLQHTHYVAVTDKDKMNMLYEAAFKQYKVLTASAVIVVLGDMDAYKHVAAMNEGLLNLGVISQQEYDQIVSSTTDFYLNRGESFRHEDAVRNASLSAMQFMLIAKDKGWDTCPMIGYDPDKVRSALNVPDHLVPVMMITIGKEDTSSQRPRGYRKPVHEFVTFQSF
ncbi:nitroreductase family protein [Paenibacillus popilliae]|uniref:Nitroreductase family protein n=1 Tax=Paenibacillus popilliae TaxID=78057 RepID=A0ABY3AJX8_PAEPP|nr:nitroreductase family protein [Paenibacillus sp. SDF0028]TQR42741.1 nitroreductase family protein [Paenibacillus sp. SDF0028]